MSNHDNIVSRCSAKSTTITDFLFDIGNDCSFWHFTEGEDVADGQIGLLSRVDELSGVHSFIGDEGFCSKFEAVGISEGDFGEGSTTTWVMNDFFDDSADVSMSFSVLLVSTESIYWNSYIENSEFCCTLSKAGVRLENAARLSIAMLDIHAYKN